MTEHVCEWVQWDEKIGWYACTDDECPFVLNPMTVLSRLNATERLSAVDVEANIDQIESCEFECHAGPIELNTGYIRLRDDLKAYADMLEGKC